MNLQEEEEDNGDGRRKKEEDKERNKEGGSEDGQMKGGGGGSRDRLKKSVQVSPVLQLVHAGVGRTADTGDLLPLLPLRQLLRNEVRQQRLGDVQEVGQLHHHVLTNSRGTFTFISP